MYKAKNGLGDANYREVANVAATIDQLKVNEEVSYTQDSFESEQLYDTVLGGLKVAGFVCELNCGVHRWFLNKEDGRDITCDFRDDVIILRRGENYGYRL